MHEQQTVEPERRLPRLGPVDRELEPPRAPVDASRLLADGVVERARAGDEQAFAFLVERYGQPLLSLCYASTLDAAEAEDLAQEIFLAAWQGLPRFRGQAAFSTWLFALARNACVDRARAAASRPRLAREQGDPPEPQSGSEAARDTALAILQAASSLSLPLRQSLLLRDVQGLSYEEIAELQAVALGTVRSRIAAARAAVAKVVRR